jgi:hypothetical protein
MPIGGPVCFTVGAMALVPAVKSILWHQGMLRHSIPKDYPARYPNN